MDILNSDLQLKVEATSKRSRSGKDRHDEFETDAGFHFIAFVPALAKSGSLTAWSVSPKLSVSMLRSAQTRVDMS